VIEWSHIFIARALIGATAVANVSHIRRLSSALLDFVYPPYCPGCDACQAPDDRQALCAECIRSLHATPWPRCDRCCAPLGATGAEPGTPLRGCQNCFHRPQSGLERVLVLSDFVGIAERAIHNLKFNGIKQIGSLLGSHIAADPDLRQQLDAVELLVPVPLHPARQRERGFNQAELISVGLADKLRIPVDSVSLTRHRPTVQQARLEADDRLANTSGAFTLLPPLSGLNSRAHPGTIGLVDDVATTGATLSACAAALQGHTDARIIGIAVASPFRSVAESIRK
jgi:ComF family protein